MEGLIALAILALPFLHKLRCRGLSIKLSVEVKKTKVAKNSE